MRKSIILISFFSLLTSIICALYLLKSNFASIALMPLVYAMICPLSSLSFQNRNTRITVVIVYSLFFVRMVFLPLYGIIDGYFSSGPDAVLSRYCNKSVYLSIYELVAVALTLYAFTGNKTNTVSRPNLNLSGNGLIYLLLVLIAISLYITVGKEMELFEFGFKSIGGDYERSGDIEDRGIVHLLIETGVLFLFLITQAFFSIKYKSHPKNRYILYAIVIAMVMISLISGERRTSQIYKGFACIWLLIGLYPAYKKRISRSLLIVAGIVIAGMTLYKQYHAFLYDSYIEALNHASGVGMSTGILDAYFYGVNTISKNLAFSDMGGVGFTNLLYDFARNLFGLNFIIPRGMSLTSELYNLTLSTGESATGYLLSSVGYGYIYLGFVLAPFFSCMNIWILIVLERFMKSTSSIEMSYIWALIYMRYGFGFLGSFPPLLNLSSRILFVNGGIVLLASLFNRSLKHIS